VNISDIRFLEMNRAFAGLALIMMGFSIADAASSAPQSSVSRNVAQTVLGFGIFVYALLSGRTEFVARLPHARQGLRRVVAGAILVFLFASSIALVVRAQSPWTIAICAVCAVWFGTCLVVFARMIRRS
jgi:hypothetical protein